ncbi:MAG: helix-turn-helix transcriptional regulator [Spirochaetales bacterium]|nr:helix-turn-helix transcriptional regulator [Spirochaetales bacterium]
MNKHIIFTWIIAYSLCMVTMAFGFSLYLQKKEKTVFAFMMFLLSSLLVSVFILLSPLFDLSCERFLLIKFNIRALYFISGNCFLFSLFKIKISVIKLSFLVVLWLVLINLFAAFICPEIVQFLVFGYVLPIFFSVSYIFGIKLKGKPRPRVYFVGFWRNLGSTFLLSGTVSFITGSLCLILVSLNIVHLGDFIGYYFAVRLICSITPGLVYFFHELKKLSSISFSSNTITEGMNRIGLSPREQEVAAQIINGMKYEEIADTLFISLPTVKKHAYNTYRKAEVSNCRQLIQKIMH